MTCKLAIPCLCVYHVCVDRLTTVVLEFVSNNQYGKIWQKGIWDSGRGQGLSSLLQNISDMDWHDL